MFERLLEQIAAELASRSIPYLIVGGQAVLVHGEPRLTRDIDITLGVDVDRFDDLLTIVTPWHVQRRARSAKRTSGSPRRKI
jgi:hypothetical protein